MEFVLFDRSKLAEQKQNRTDHRAAISRKSRHKIELRLLAQDVQHKNILAQVTRSSV